VYASPAAAPDGSAIGPTEEEVATAVALGLSVQPPEAVTVWVGRLAIVAIGIVSILWLPVIPLMGD